MATFPALHAQDWRTPLQDYIDNSGPGVELAAAEVSYSFNTAFGVSPAPAASIVGARIIVPATTRPVMIEYGADATVAVSGGGLLQLQVWTDPGFAVPHYTSHGVTSGQITSYSGSRLPLRGQYRLAASTSNRTYFLAVILFRDSGSSLTANIPNVPENPSYIRAVTL